MKRVGRGLQYTVFKKNKKVTKILNSKRTIKKILLLWYPHRYFLRPKKLEKVAQDIRKNTLKNVTQIKKLKDTKILGNPIIKKESIDQDLVIPLGKIIRKTKNPQEYIQKTIQLIFDCWKEGFSDLVYNFTINNGVTKNKEVILLDFGEVTFDKETVKKQIKSKRWLRAWSYKVAMPFKLRKYYKKEMRKNITLKNLNKYWKNKK